MEKKPIIPGIVLPLIIFAAFCASLAYAAPLPWGIAVKSETKECAGYWPGDEYVAYALPEGWSAYFPGENDIISTEFGNCEFRKWAGDEAGEEEKCCKALGLSFVSGNIGLGNASYPYLVSLAVGSIALIVIVLLVWLLIRKVKAALKKSSQ